MKIMQIVSGKDMNGAMRHSLLLSRELIRRGNELTIVCREDSWIRDQAASDGIAVVESDLHRWPTDELTRIARILADGRFDIMHTHMSRAHFFGVLLRFRTKVPCVATAHSQLIQPHWMFNDLVIAVSEATRRFHRCYNLVPRRRIVTVHNFVDEEALGPVSPEVRCLRRSELGADDDDLLIGSVGSIIPRKGILNLIRAMPRILATVPNARLAIIGNPQDRRYTDRAHQVASTLGVEPHITWAGHGENIHELMASLDVLAMPSRKENLPLAILEAMAAGIPVVATDVGGVSECVQSGKTGVLVPPNDTTALANAVGNLLLDPERGRRLGKAAKDRVHRSFSTQSQAAAIEAAYARTCHIASGG